MLAAWGARIAGIWSITVSFGLLASLWLRPEASVNWLNAITLGLASISGYLALRYPRQVKALTGANLLLLMASVPTIFGWIVYLYLPPLAILTVVLLWLFVTRACGARASTK